MTPRPKLASTGYCLAAAGEEYLVYQAKAGEAFSVDLKAGSYRTEWFDPQKGESAGEGRVDSPGGDGPFKPPFDGPAVQHLKREAR